MRNAFVLMSATAIAVFVCYLAPAQVAAQAAASAAVSSAVEFDPHDLRGVWETNHDGTGGFRALTREQFIPPRTPWGEARYLTTVTGRNSTLAGPGVPPAIGNDPIMQCNPYGYPRILTFIRPVEFFQLDNRLLMHFEWQGPLREVWLDGRALPKDPLPTWYGYSVGHWEGDTLVIDSSGFDDRGWLDIYGNVFSDEMRLRERWRRTGPDTLELTIRLDDPKTYTKPWVSSTKIFKRRSDLEIREELCAPVDENNFDQQVRDPSGVEFADNQSKAADKATLDQFVAALLAIHDIKTKAAKQIQEASNEEAGYKLQEQARADMLNAVRSTGISLVAFRQMANRINADRDFRASVIEHIMGHFNNPE